MLLWLECKGLKWKAACRSIGICQDSTFWSTLYLKSGRMECASFRNFWKSWHNSSRGAIHCEGCQDLFLCWLRRVSHVHRCRMWALLHVIMFATPIQKQGDPTSLGWFLVFFSATSRPPPLLCRLCLLHHLYEFHFSSKISFYQPHLFTSLSNLTLPNLSLSNQSLSNLTLSDLTLPL